TNLHEIIGHGSGLVEPAVADDLASRLREQYSTLEETRADLVALYFVADPQLVALGLCDAGDHRDIVLAEYEGYARMLADVQRIKAQADHPAAAALFEAHGTHFAAALRDEVLARTEALDLPA